MRRTVLGLVFLVVGLIILAAVLGPALLGLFAHPPVTATISLALLTVGILLAVFGALMIDPASTSGAMTTITVKLGNTSLPFVGGRRAGDTDKQVDATITVGPKDGGS